MPTLFNFSSSDYCAGYVDRRETCIILRINKQNKGFRELRNRSAESQKPLVQAFFSTFVPERAFYFCIRISRNIDPACGSGIFLVGAFKRLINIWRSQNNWQRPDVDTLKSILKQSIFGIELDRDAIHLTAFSMCLAICDALQPNVIWEELKFDKLRESNLLEADFFNALLDLHQDKPSVLQNGFDIVIGNPPFESRLSAAGIEINKAAQHKDNERGKLPDNQLAYLFLEQAFNILRPDGTVCLIQPHGLLYNSFARKFQTAIFQKHRIDTILDFVSIRKLYEGADSKTIAILAQPSEPPDNHQIMHQTFRRTVSVKEHICFEIDHYDWHYVPQKQAESYQYIWRSNLLGGSRLFDISQRFQSMRNLAEFVKQQCWDYGNGFIVGKADKPATFLTGKDFLPASAFNVGGIDESKIRPLDEIGFERPRNEDLYTPPLILIKKIDSLPVIFWNKSYLTYNYRIVGIHSPLTQEPELLKLYNALSQHHEFYQFFCALNGMSLLGTATALSKEDIDKLPYPEDLNELSLSFWEKALCEDTVKYMTEYVRLGQNSELLKRAANSNDLQDYAELFTRMLKSVYSNLQVGNPIFVDGLICQPFYFGERPDSSWLTEQQDIGLRKLIYDDEKHSFLRTVRILRLYSENLLLLIKPDRLRYWIRSAAVRDADETIVDLNRQGY
ncbi:HsdM family class I SAM-dependent methyltransferase [Dehalococcoides mccartyi]|uniref:HsdM family class I SAM-dependent methyltransferase n=1 Tax=Dehalococcoides mccartyi TaxID=61435 RepID=UPI0019FEA6D9|nr:N-6 DNA methylase [Dehalococcoides mccartyi]MBF4482106.1 N-6 DNA methylase [Dehalococcoides mccartyi]MBJ7531110.1 N-6 DNA methylase [Dehalococcoides mccartyi]